METIKQYAQRLKSITVEQLLEQVRQIVKDNEATAIDLNLAQLLQGIDSRGEELYPPYSPTYAKQKELLGLPGDRVTLKLEGDFHNSFFMDASDWPVMFGATDSKTDKLMQKYGGEIFGLTKESTEELVEFYLKEQIQLFFSRLLLIR